MLEAYTSRLYAMWNCSTSPVLQQEFEHHGPDHWIFIHRVIKRRKHLCQSFSISWQINKQKKGKSEVKDVYKRCGCASGLEVYPTSDG